MSATDLILKFYIAKPLAEPSALEVLDRVVSEQLPHWRSELYLLPEHEDDKTAGARVLGALADALPAVAPMRYGLCAANMQGAYDGVAAFLQCSRKALPPESNMLTVEIADLVEVEGKPVSDWALGFFRAVVASLPARYAHARTRAEFEAKNMIREGRSVKAIGANLKRSLPGLYWLNFFGNEYVDLIGSDRLASAPVPDVEPIDAGFCIRLGDGPTDWSTEGYQQREAAVMSHFGNEFFFSRLHSERPTRAPSFS